jgi:hypothetical protein
MYTAPAPLCYPQYAAFVKCSVEIQRGNLAVPISTLIKHYAMKACGEWRYSSTILYLGTRKVSGEIHDPVALPPGKAPSVLIV